MADPTVTDVLCVGAGLGGLVAALTAHELGFRAMVSEKTSKLGGVTATSAGQIWVPGNHLQSAAGVQDSWQLGAEHITAVGAGTADRERLDALLQRAPRVAQFLEAATSMRWRLISCADYYAGVAPYGLTFGRYLEANATSVADLGQWQHRLRRGLMFPDRMSFEEFLAMRRSGVEVAPDELAAREAADIRYGGAGLMAHLVRAVVERGVPVATDATVTSLQRHSSAGWVVRVSNPAGEHELVVHGGIVLATGGYDRSLEMVRSRDHIAEFGTLAHAGITGDSLRLAGVLGAQTSTNQKPFMLGFQVPGEADEEGQPLWRVVSPQANSVLVNDRADRFVNELHYPAVTQAVLAVDGRLQRRPNSPTFFICDAGYLQRFGIGGTFRDDELPPQVRKANTLDELARQFGLDEARLHQTISRFNDFSRTGRDRDFARGESVFERRFLPQDLSVSDLLGTITTAPFYGLTLTPVGMGFANTGLVGNIHGQILDWNDEPIPGLYGAGNTLAMSEIGSGYQSGFANTRGMVYGYSSACHIVERMTSPLSNA